MIVCIYQASFGNSSEDYNRFLNQLITFNTFYETRDFVQEMVKPDYNNWEGKQDYDERFMDIIEKILVNRSSFEINLILLEELLVCKFYDYVKIIYRSYTHWQSRRHDFSGHSNTKRSRFDSCRRYVQAANC
jgi:hypothetical protein